MRERELGGPAVALDVPHDEQAQRDARAVLEVLVPGAVVLDGALEDLGVRPDREARPPGGVEAAGERGLQLRLPGVHPVVDGDVELDLVATSPNGRRLLDEFDLDAIAAALAEYVDPIRHKLAEIESRPVLSWAGTWRPDRAYYPGRLTQRDGGLWGGIITIKSSRYALDSGRRCRFITPEMALLAVRFSIFVAKGDELRKCQVGSQGELCLGPMIIKQLGTESPEGTLGGFPF